MLANIPVLGVGLGYREPFKAGLFLHRKAIDFLEVTADHFFGDSSDKATVGKTGPISPTSAAGRDLALLKAHFPLIPHALNLSLGSAEGLDSGYLHQLAAVIEAVDPPYWSEHIALTKAGGVEIGHLSPVPFSRESTAIVARNIRTAQDLIARPLILENITYHVRLPFSDLDEAAFLGELLDVTSCGLLLDVTNLHTNSVNHRFDAVEFLRRLPPDKIVQLHFVGGHWRNGTLIDSHSHTTTPEIWSLLDEVLKYAPVKGMILERDENIPPFAELIPELEQARALGRKHGRW